MTSQTIPLTTDALQKLVTEEAIEVETNMRDDEEQVIRLEPPAWETPNEQVSQLLFTIIAHAEYNGVKPTTIAHLCGSVLMREFHREGLSTDYDSLFKWLRAQNVLTNESADSG